VTEPDVTPEVNHTHGKKRRRPSDVVLIHLAAATVVLISAYAGHIPFLWVVNTHAHRLSWLGFGVVWLLGTAAYFLIWQQIGQYNRVVEVLATILIMLNGCWAALVLLSSAADVLGIGVTSLLTWTLPWFLRIVVAVVTLLACLLYVRLGKSSDEATEGEPLRNATPPPSAVLVSAAGFLLGAWSLALLAPPQATQAEAQKAVASVASRDVDTRDVTAFQGSVDRVVERESALHPRDRWGTLRGFFGNKNGKVVYDNTIQWGVLVLYRDEVACIARDISSHHVVVRAGYCPA
jgi:hypothetical protein